MSLPRYDWSIPPKSVEPPPFAAAHGLVASIWPLVALRFPEATRDEASLQRLLAPRLADITPPFEFPGIREAAARLSEAIDGAGDIVVFGDFDADGVTATAILVSTIRSMGGRVRPFIPLRSEGYGLSDAAVARCLDGGVPDLLVTVDCGITAGAALKRFADLGTSIIVTDHHIPDGSLPEGAILAAPHLETVPQQCRDLCGAGVAFTLAAGLVATRFPEKNEAGIAARHRLFSWLDALSIATVADVVSLKGENRTFVTLGLRALNKCPSPGLRQLLLATMDGSDVTERHLGFVLGPHINSAGRMADASLAFELLIAQEQDDARALAIRLKQTNALRKGECAKVDEAAAAQIASPDIFDKEKDGAFVGAGDGWHQGVVGLAAAHAADRLCRPAALVAFSPGGDIGRGSVRGPAGYDVHAALAECAEYLDAFGGHESAAGLSITRDQLAAFRAAFSAACLRQAGATAATPTLDIAARISLGEVNLDLLKAVNSLAPFGEGNEEPVFEIDGLAAKASILGRDVPKGLRLSLSDAAGATLEGLWFGTVDHLQDFRDHSRWDFAATLLPDDYSGRHGVKLKIIDARRA